MPDKLQSIYEASFTSKTVKLNAKNASVNFVATPIPTHSYYVYSYYPAKDRHYPAKSHWYISSYNTDIYPKGNELKNAVDETLKSVSGASIQSYTANVFNVKEDGTVVIAIYTRGVKEVSIFETGRLFIDANSMDSNANEDRLKEIGQELKKFDSTGQKDWRESVNHIVKYIEDIQNIKKAQTQHTATHGVDLSDL